MKERPILFNGAMVRAILEGRKTQTRRIMKPQPVHMDSHVWSFGDFIWSDQETRFPLTPDQALAARCPHGKVGDRLWVRESIAPTRDTDLGYIVDWHYAADGAKVPRMPYLDPQFSDAMAFAHLARKSVPSIHMPRWASRTTLEVTGVRVERLQAISEADAEAEGIDFLRHVPDADETLTARQLFMCLWDSLATPGSDWAANPWVWVIEFRRSGE